MKIQDNIEMHSFYIEELFDSEKVIRARTHDIGQKIAVHTHILDQHDENIANLVKHAKSTSDSIKELMNDQNKQKSIFEFIKSIFEKPINWFYIGLLLLMIESIKGINAVSIIKDIMTKFF